jgi:hypothetical protein
MKNLIKAGLLLLFLSFSIQSFSQFRLGVKAGLNIASIRQNFSSTFSDYELKNPVPRVLYSVGPCFDIGLGRWLSLQPALLLSAKGVGADVKKEYDANSGYDRWTINYLEIPINVAVKFKGFQVFAGPYFAIALAGNNKWNIDYGGGDKRTKTEKLSFVSGKVDPNDLDAIDPLFDFFSWHLKRFDYGLNLGAGYKLGPVLFSAGYSLGLANLTPSIKDVGTDLFDPKDAKRSTSTFTISVSYFFGRWR